MAAVSFFLEDGVTASVSNRDELPGGDAIKSTPFRKMTDREKAHAELYVDVHFRPRGYLFAISPGDPCLADFAPPDLKPPVRS